MVQGPGGNADASKADQSETEIPGPEEFSISNGYEAIGAPLWDGEKGRWVLKVHSPEGAGDCGKIV